MTDHNTIERQQFIKSISDNAADSDSKWWWAIAIVALVMLFMLVSRVGPVVFPAG